MTTKRLMTIGRNPLLAVVLVSATTMLSGCGGLFVAEGASTVVSGKTVSDHVISLASGKDCSIVRTEKGLTYCVEDEAVVNQDRYFCYRTLADVTCYTSAHPSHTQDTRLGINEQNQVQ